jgi:cytochrome c
LIADPNFAKNNWIYMYYADPNDKKHVLARWELKGDEFVEASKKMVLEVPTQREECCHTGGGMVFDKVGNLYLTTGNNTSNSNSDGYANLDERPNQSTWDDQRGAAAPTICAAKFYALLLNPTALTKSPRAIYLAPQPRAAYRPMGE